MRYSYMTFIKLHTHNSQKTIIIKAKPLAYFMSGKKCFYSSNGQPAVAIENYYNYLCLFISLQNMSINNVSIPYNFI